jgi:hypothetical protein
MVWLGNKNGIALYDLETVSYIQPTGYPEDIYSIREDDNCNIWVCGKTALSKYHYNVNAIEETQINNNMLSIYPNPVKNEFFIDLSENTQNDVLEIYATNGSIVHEQRVEHGNNTINICNLKAGMYLVRLKTANIYGKLFVE